MLPADEHGELVTVGVLPPELAELDSRGLAGVSCLAEVVSPSRAPVVSFLSLSLSIR